MSKATSSPAKRQPPRALADPSPMAVARATTCEIAMGSMQRACRFAREAEDAARSGDRVRENRLLVHAKDEVSQAIRANAGAIRYGSPFPRFMSRVLQPVSFQRGDES